MPLTSRFYKQKLPALEDVVMVNVKAIAEMGAYVELLEYSNIEGMILLSELSRRRIRSINKLIKIGRNECVQVIRVDQNKEYIDLSKRRVAPEEILMCEEKFARGKTINSIMRHTAEVLGIDNNEDFEQLYERTAWYFDEKYKKPGVCYDIFKLCINDPSVLDECDIDAHTKEILLKNIKSRLTPQPIKCRADIEVACYGYEGIDAIKNSLKAGLSVASSDVPVKINLIAPPVFVVTLTSLDRSEGLRILRKVVDVIKETITTKYKGIFKISLEPKVVTDHDDSDLRRRLEEAEAELREVPGDDDEKDGESQSNSSSGEEDEDEDEEEEEESEDDNDNEDNEDEKVANDIG